MEKESIFNDGVRVTVSGVNGDDVVYGFDE